MKRLILIIAISWFMAYSGSSQSVSLHNFSTVTLMGEEFNLEDLKGKKVLVVNTASKCGYTPQYEQLQAIYEKYGGDRFTIIAFPSNDFLHQEPGSEEEILNFCKKNYGVTFPVMHKISVKGKKIDPIYAWLTNKSENGVQDAKVKWNFQKFMIDENGGWVDFAESNVKPTDPKIINWIEEK